MPALRSTNTNRLRTRRCFGAIAALAVVALVAVAMPVAADIDKAVNAENNLFAVTRSYCGQVYATVLLRDPTLPPNASRLPITIYVSEPSRGLARTQVLVLNPGSPQLTVETSTQTMFASSATGRGPGFLVEFTWAGGSSTVQTDPYVDNCYGSFVPIIPTRVLDTRSGVGAPAGPVATDQVVSVDLAPALDGRTSGVTSLVANITATNPTTAGYVTAYACGDPAPTASNVNFSAGETVPNLAVVDLVGRSIVGKLCLYSSTVTDLLVDITGYYVDDPSSVGNGSLFTALDSPQRLLDSRGGLQVAAGSSVRVPTAGRAGIPADIVRAMSLNVTVTEPATGGYLTVYPCDTEVPQTSSLNFVAGQTRANASIVATGTGGDVCVYASTTTHLIVDAMGYYGPTGFTIWNYAPIRLWDTRVNATTGRPAPKLTGPNSIGYPFVNGVPGDIVSLNLTITAPDSAGYASVYPCNNGRPASSNINFVAGQTIANTVQVRLDSDRRICIYISATTYFILDASATFFVPR